MSDQSGSASIYALAAATLIVATSLPVVVAGLGLAAHRSAVRAADLAALGGAQQSLSNAPAACATAARVARANGAYLQRCSLTSDGLTVEVALTTSLPLVPPVSATSRAGLLR